MAKHTLKTKGYQVWLQSPISNGSALESNQLHLGEGRSKRAIKTPGRNKSPYELQMSLLHNQKEQNSQSDTM